MKALKLVVLGIILFLAGTAQSQVSVNVNIGSPPMWGPAGYTDVQYYYLPDVEAYYDVPSSRFIYYDGGVWVHRTYLPRRYRNYDLYSGYKVVMTDYRGNAPYYHFKEYKTKYAKGYRGHEQHNIGVRPGRGNSHDRYSNGGNRGNQGNNHGYNKSEGHGKGNGGGHDKGNGHGHGKNK